jgi:lipopolysaccharide/colanic/teichoic acid biosynthesis glycosyltransferase
MYLNTLKRPLDVIVSLVAIVIFLPLLVAIALLTFLKLGKPILFRQERIGLNGRIFTILKFRTMSAQLSDDGSIIPEAFRLTGFGRRIRALGLDELPQLLNIFRGEMSFVGPRPLLPEYLELYSNQQARRHEVRPGITGLAQVSGRNLLSWSERFELDVEYISRISAWLDLKILVRTLSSVISRHGASPADGEITEPFSG